MKPNCDQRCLPVNVSPGIGNGYAQCVRLRDGRLHVFQPGSFPPFLTGHQFILADQELAHVLHRLCGPALEVAPVDVIHYPTEKLLAKYLDIRPTAEVTPATVRQVDASGTGAWHFAHSHLFVTQQVAADLQAIGYGRLRYSDGFEDFAGTTGAG